MNLFIGWQNEIFIENIQKKKMRKMSKEEYFEKLGELEDKYSVGFINMD